MARARTAFYAAVFCHLWTARVVPTPQALAEWIESQPWADPPPDYPTLIQRLKLWPQDKPYPAFPDDEALRHGVTADPRWWMPGASHERPPLPRAITDQVAGATQTEPNR
jgi:hypothetical protein